MSSSPFASANHPTLDWAVTPDQRAKAEDYLQQAYVDGRLSKDEFDERMAKALAANTRRELNDAFDGLARIPTAFPGSPMATSNVMPWAAASSLPARPRDATTTGALAHFSGAFTWFLGPALIAAGTRKGTVAHQQAAKAFNAVLSSTIVIAVLGSVSHLPLMHWVNGLTGIATVMAFIFMIVGGIKATNGEQWTNPFQRLLPIRVLDERK